MKYITRLQEQAYDRLKQMILEKKLLPDIIYSERRISEDLGISRTPMRDAVHLLAQEGYIDVIPSKGFRLHKMTQDDLIHAYEARCALEGFCAMQLARSHTLPETKRVLHVLESLVDDQDKIASTTNDVETFAAYDMEFHKRIVDASNNPIFSSTFDLYQYQMNAQTIASLHSEGRLHDTVKEHRTMVENMKSGNERGSYDSTIKHIGMAQTLIDLD